MTPSAQPMRKLISTNIQYSRRRARPENSAYFLSTAMYQSMFSPSAKRKLGCDCNLRMDRAVDRTCLREEAVHALRRFALRGLGLEQHLDMNPLDHQYVSFQLHLSDGFRDQFPGGRGDLTRLQRASESPGQSTRRGRHDVVDGRRVRLVRAGLGAVVLRHRAVGAEFHRLRLLGKKSVAQRALDSFDAHLRAIGD